MVAPKVNLSPVIKGGWQIVCEPCHWKNRRFAEAQGRDRMYNSRPLWVKKRVWLDWLFLRAKVDGCQTDWWELVIKILLWAIHSKAEVMTIHRPPSTDFAYILGASKSYYVIPPQSLHLEAQMKRRIWWTSSCTECHPNVTRPTSLNGAWLYKKMALPKDQSVGDQWDSPSSSITITHN